MPNKQTISIPLPSKLELIEAGASSHENIYNMLAKAHGFEIFEPSELAFIAKHMNSYRIPAGGTLFCEGDKNSNLGLLVKGRISVYKEDSDNLCKLFGFVTEGRFFGEISVIDDLPYSASLVAESEVTILLMSRDNFRKCIADNSIIGVRLLKIIARLLAARLRSTSSKLADYIDV